MGTTSSNLSSSSKQTLLACILKNWEQLDPQTLKKKHLIFFCTKTWPQYNLSDGERCPPEGTLNYNTILLLSLSCKWEGKRSEIPYVQVFFALREDPTSCKNCGFSQSVPPVVSSESLSQNCYPYLGLTKSNPPEPHQSLSIPLVIPTSKLYPSFLSLQEVASGEWGQVWVHVPFLLQDLQQIKICLGNFTNKPDKHIENFQGLTQSFDLAWRDIMLLLSQTFTGGDREKLIKLAQEWRDEWYAINARGRSSEQLAQFPMGCQAVAINDPNWAPNKDDRGGWDRKHFITCIIEGLKRAWTEPLNYSKLSKVNKGEKESPLTFMERLREALRKNTPTDHTSVVCCC